ncbi:apoptosis-associated speck-like protein containing a CARD [Cynoglossus semilaevis]|nr:apoptosis-associated speck-like protein containing a CARD [Cynoglossus semilaevis]
MTSACTITEAIADILEDLSEQNFEKFRHLLLDRRTNPRIKRGRVEGKNFLGVTEVMVSTFTEDGALTVTEELLRKIGLNAEANHLVEDTKNLSVGKVFSDDRTVFSDDSQHFLDKHRIQLTQRVTNIDPILDELLDQNVIQQESYEKIRSMPTSQGKMRELYSSALKAGRTCKDIFYQILKKNEPYLIKDLEKM